jgi:hypothetical protein
LGLGLSGLGSRAPTPLPALSARPSGLLGGKPAGGNVDGGWSSLGSITPGAPRPGAGLGLGLGGLGGLSKTPLSKPVAPAKPDGEGEDKK